MSRKYAKPLNLYYQYSPEEGKLTFEDGVTYTAREAILLSRGRPHDADCRAVHLVKAVFRGVLEACGKPEGPLEIFSDVPFVLPATGKKVQAAGVVRTVQPPAHD